MIELRYTLRGLVKSPGFFLIAVLTLAVGIGASTAILTVVDAVLLRSLPFPDAGRLVALFATTPQRGSYRDSTSFPDFQDWKSQTQAFSGAAAYRMDRFTLTGDGTPEAVVGLRASHELFDVLGTSPLIGRGFDQQEQRAKSAVTVIGHGLWRRRFGGEPSVLGKSVLINGVSHLIIGVLPQRFLLPPATDADVIIPIPENVNRGSGYLFGVARLRPGVQAGSAQRELDVVAERLAQTYPTTNRGRGVNVVALHEVAVGWVRIPLILLVSAGLFVLLVGCANVGNLVLARAIARQREFAMRKTLGATTGRLVWQLLSESVTVAMTAALFGVALANWMSRLLVTSLSQFPLPTITIDWRLLTFAVGLAIVSGILCGLVPALVMSRSDLNESLKQGGWSVSSGITQQRLRSALVIAETALTVVLLLGAGLLLRSLMLLQHVNLGLDPQNVLTADLLLSRRYADVARREVYLRDLTEALSSVPGAQHVAIVSDPLFKGGSSSETFTIEGHPDPGPSAGHPAAFNVVTPAVFRVLGIPIVSGRPFDQRDAATGEPVAIVNDTFARQFWPAGDAIGRRIRLYYDKDPQRWVSIVGIMAGVRYAGREIAPEPQVFVPFEQNPYRSLPYRQEPFAALIVRTAADPAALASAVQAKIWSVDPDQVISNLRPLEQVLARAVDARRVYSLLLGLFAGVALAIATAGVYGVMSYEIVRRTPEMGVRVALGATRRQILALVLGHGLRLAAIGVVIGCAAALALAQVISGLLVGVAATDTLTYLAVLLLFTAVAFVATYIPARRATMLDPTVAFRSQ